MTYFVLYSTCQPIKDNLIGSLLYFYKKKKRECHFCDLFPTFTNPQTNLKITHFYFLCALYWLFNNDKKHLHVTFVLYSPL